MTKVNRVICIYKITSPSGRVYIGQTINYKRRVLDYKNKLAYKQPALNASFKKYGFDKHLFEAVHELPHDVTQVVFNEYECLYMELYRGCGIKLLNTREGGSNGRNSEESIKKATDGWKKWYASSDKAKELALSLGRSNKGRKVSDEKKMQVSALFKGKKKTEDHQAKITAAIKGKPKNLSPEQRRVNSLKLKAFSGENRKAVVQYSLAGVFIKDWTSATEAQSNISVSRKVIEKCCKGIGYTGGGFLWCYNGGVVDPTKANSQFNLKPISVSQFNRSGVFIRDWDSITKAGNSLGIHISYIVQCCKGKRHHAGGYLWKYKTPTEAGA